MLTHDDTPLDSFLEGIEKRARFARLLSIALTIIPVLVGVLFLLFTLKQVQKAQAELRTTEDNLQQKRLEVEEKDREVAEKEKRLEFLGKALQALPPGVAEEAIKKTINSNPHISEAIAVPVVYIQISNESQRAAAKEAANRLQEKGYIVPGIENVGKKAPDKTELRSFHGTPQEAEDTKDITRILQDIRIAAQAKKIGAYGDTAVRARRYELWFANEYIPGIEYIQGIEVTRLSSKELKLNVQYTYDGSEGARAVYFGASALQRNGDESKGTSFSPGPVKPGKSSVMFTIEMMADSQPFISTRLRVCMYVAGGKTIACKNVDYPMEWK
jgi:hypothetical protein